MKTLNARTFNNDGLTTWSGDGTFDLTNGSTFNDTAGFVGQNNATMTHSFGAPSTFNNTGIFEKSASTGTTIVQDVVFNNADMVDVQTGTLRLATTGASTGMFQVHAGATLEMSSGSHTFNAGAAVAGEGTLRLIGATLTVAANVSADNVALTAGNLTGNGTLTCNESLLWTGGTMTGMGQTRVAASAMGTISGGFLKTAQMRSLNNQGPTTWLDAGNLDLSNGTTSDNSGTFQVEHRAGRHGAGYIRSARRRRPGDAGRSAECQHDRRVLPDPRRRIRDPDGRHPNRDIQ